MADATATPTKAATAAASKAAEKASADVLPAVAETVEVGLAVPSKVVLNQKMVVTVSILGGAALAIGGMVAGNYLKRKRDAKKAEESVSDPSDNTTSDSVHRVSAAAKPSKKA